jgi:hypothetical protein
MEERVEREVRTTLQVIGVSAPRHFLCVYGLSRRFPRVQPYAHRGLLLERMQVSLEAPVTHQLTGIFLESKW